MVPRIRRRLLATVLTVVIGSAGTASTTWAQWTSLGEMSAPRRDGNSLVFRGAQGVASVTVLAPEVVRVRFVPAREFGRDHSYAVASRDLGAVQATFTVGAAQSTVTTPTLTVTIRHRPFRVAFANAEGESLDEDDPATGLALSGQRWRLHKRLRVDEQVYGFGEKSGRLNKRGKMLGGYSYAMWNTDAYGYDAGIDPLYASFPFYIVLRKGRAHGLFLDNTHRTSFDIGKTSPELLSFGAEAGELDYYFIEGPHPKDVITRYTALTGRMPLPPLWSLGLHQCRYSYYPESKVRYVADSFRLKKIPADTLWLDIHYLDGYNPLTWDAARFPDPAGLVRDLRSQGFRLVTIVDPHPKKQPGWDVYDSGLAGGHLVTRADGSVYEAPVWPANAERNPGPSVFPDFSRPATRTWWGGLFKRLTDIGIAGIWNDMNEPAIFQAPTWTMPLDVRHDNEGQPTSHREIHNVYGMLMTKSTFEGLATLRPDERPFVLTRATFAGGQRYAALWAGDNISRWADLQASLPLLSNLGLSGMPFVGVDIGGFGDSPTPELFTRWLQAGVFYPFMRIHTADGTEDQEPWSFGVSYEKLNRQAIELRYQLLPHIYNAMKETADTGVPALRPLLLEFPDDWRTWELDDQFMFGGDLLVAPVVEQARTSRDVYLPRGAWFDFWTGRRVEGGASVRRAVTLDTWPIFVREGAFVFGQPVVQHTGEMPAQVLRVAVYPAAASERTLYEDDGHTMAYRRGEYLRRRFSQSRIAGDEGDTRVIIDVGPAEGSYRPRGRPIELSVRFAGTPRAVRLTSGGSTSDLARVELPRLAQQRAGWAVNEEGFVVVRHPDVFDGLRLTIEP